MTKNLDKEIGGDRFEISNMRGAKVILAQMMKELSEDGWPSDATWNAGLKVLSKKPMPEVRAGIPVSTLKLMNAKPQKFIP